MLTLDDLKAKAQQDPTSKCTEEIELVINSDADVKDAVIGLINYFGEDDKRQAVRLIVKGKEVGCLIRSDLDDFAALLNLMAKAQQNPTSICKGEIALVIDSVADVKKAVSWLINYFGEDDKRQAVRLIVKGKEVGCLIRSDLDDFVDPLEMGIDVSGPASLPGDPNSRLIQFCCPVQACEYSFLTPYFDEDSPPTCKKHTSERMVIKQ